MRGEMYAPTTFGVRLPLTDGLVFPTRRAKPHRGRRLGGLGKV
jgi:hypothetical protein